VDIRGEAQTALPRDCTPGEVPACVLRESWGETLEKVPEWNIREGKGKDQHPGWQTHCLRAEEGHRTVTNDGNGKR